MRIARKHNRRVKAYKLGEGSPVESSLINKGVIRETAEGYRIISRESITEGELAQKGDYFKVDGDFAYPIENATFTKTHRYVGGDEYEQDSPKLSIWMAGDPISEELKFLIDNGKLKFNLADNDRYFNAYTWGTCLVGSKDAVIVIYEVQHNPDGSIFNIDFGLVDRSIFNRDYELL